MSILFHFYVQMMMIPFPDFGKRVFASFGGEKSQAMLLILGRHYLAGAEMQFRKCRIRWMFWDLLLILHDDC